MPFVLNPQQQEALGALEWLVSPQRRSGKTIALAVAIVRAACKNPGQWVSIIDHEPGNRMCEHITGHIRAILESDARLANHTIQRNRLRVELQAPFDWFPGPPEATPSQHDQPYPQLRSQSLLSKWVYLGEL